MYIFVICSKEIGNVSQPMVIAEEVVILGCSSVFFQGPLEAEVGDLNCIRPLLVTASSWYQINLRQAPD